jgi:guanylate kinase
MASVRNSIVAGSIRNIKVVKPMNKEHVVVLVVGKTGSGKSSLIKKLCERTNLIELQSYTTRPKRSEADNDHIFVEVEEYVRAKENGEIAIDTELAGNYYYSTIEQLYNADLYTINPEALNRLLIMDLPNIRFVTVYISCPDKVREERAMKRGDDKHKYRIRDFAERQEFRKFVSEEKWDYAINNLNFPKSYSVLRWIATVEGLYKPNDIERKDV